MAIDGDDVKVIRQCVYAAINSIMTCDSCGDLAVGMELKLELVARAEPQ